MSSFFRNMRTAQPVRGRLAILVPTFRFDSRARHTIAATASMASDDIAVLIGDNSEHRAKHDYLRKLANLHPNIHVFCHDKNIGASRNWQFLFDRAVLDSYLFTGDDDFFTPGYVEGALHLLEQHDDASAAAGPFIMVTSANQMILANGGRTEASAYERCVNFPIGGGNSLPNSMARRSAAQPFLDYMFSHPLKASFFDWLMSYTILARGKYYTADQGCYLYDMANWESPESHWKNNSKFYVAAGLPESFNWFHELYWAVEFSHFFRGAYSPVEDPAQRVDCAQFFYSNRIRVFRGQWEAPNSTAGFERLVSQRPGSVDALRALVSNDDAQHPRLFGWFSEVLAAFDPNAPRRTPTIRIQAWSARRPDEPERWSDEARPPRPERCVCAARGKACTPILPARNGPCRRRIAVASALQ